MDCATEWKLVRSAYLLNEFLNEYKKIEYNSIIPFEYKYNKVINASYFINDFLNDYHNNSYKNWKNKQIENPSNDKLSIINEESGDYFLNTKERNTDYDVTLNAQKEKEEYNVNFPPLPRLSKSYKSYFKDKWCNDDNSELTKLNKL